jgi:hypothetical protein
MRFLIALLAACGIVAGAAVLPAAALTVDSEYTMAADQQAPSGQLEVDINTNEGGGAWYTSPLWIAIGVIALVLLILLIVMASRGGGTTIVRE